MGRKQKGEGAMGKELGKGGVRVYLAGEVRSGAGAGVRVGASTGAWVGNRKVETAERVVGGGWHGAGVVCCGGR